MAKCSAGVLGTYEALIFSSIYEASCWHVASIKIHLYPTDLFTISEHENPSHKYSELHKIISRFHDFKALTSSRVRSGNNPKNRKKKDEN